jgi:hypothetical protein
MSGIGKHPICSWKPIRVSTFPSVLDRLTPFPSGF